MLLRERVKYLLYRLPARFEIMTPRYRYKIDPGELAAMVELIDRTAVSGAAVIEVGVARGDTSVFLLEHLRTVGDRRPVLLFDTFRGFEPDHVRYEVEHRGKSERPFRSFRYGNERVFGAKLRRLGYERFETIAGDASCFDWRSVAPIGAMLLDVDLYQPTLAILEAVYPLLASGGGVVVDDCVEGRPWDGAHAAHATFIERHGLQDVRVGSKGALVRSPEP